MSTGEISRPHADTRQPALSGGQLRSERRVVVIGAGLDLTGAVANWGVNIKAGMEALFNRVNAAGGIHGRKIRLVAYDHVYQPPKAVTNAKRLVERDKVFLMMGHLGTPTTKAVKDYLEEKQVPNIFPATLASFAGTNSNGWLGTVMQDVAQALGYGQPLHLVIYAVLIIFFCFFYTALVFNARDTAENLRKSGAFIPGIRPGQQTADYIDKVLSRLTLWGALYVAAVCLLPEILVSSQNVPFHFGGTSLLIVVVVVMDFIAQLQAHLMSHHYPGLMKKANLLGASRGGSGT